MVVACTAKMAKFAIVCVNFVLGALGAALLGLGIWSKVDSNIYKILSFLPNISWISTLAIVVGAIIFLIGLCGCFGAFCEIRLLLIVYEAVMFALVVAELCALVAFIFLGASFVAFIKDGAKTVIKNTVGKTDGAEGEITKLIYGVQFNFECCGVDSFQDYAGSYYQSSADAIKNCPAVPITCCERYNNSGSVDHPLVKDQQMCCNTSLSNNNTAGRYQKGCLDGIVEEVWKLVPAGALYAIPIIVVSAIVLQILVLLATMGLLCAVNEADSVRSRIESPGGVYHMT